MVRGDLKSRVWAARQLSTWNRRIRVRGRRLDFRNFERIGVVPRILSVITMNFSDFWTYLCFSRCFRMVYV